MKKGRKSTSALVFPGATGWRIRLPGGQTTSVPSLDEAATVLPAGASVHLALPCHAALLERMALPSTDRDELSGMVALQLEKSLPYPVEEVSTDFDVLRQAENESTLLSVAANHAQLDQLCQPLRSKAFVPEKVTLYAQHVAAACDTAETVLCLWPEDGQLVVAVCEHGKLGYAQVLPETSPEAVTAELPGLLLRAEMEGVPTTFDRVRIEQGCGGLRDQLAALIGRPVEVFSFDAPLPEPRTNLIPSAWLDDMRKLESGDRLKSRLQLAAMLYLVLIAAGALYLVWLKNRVRQLDVQLAQTQPLVEFQQATQAKWSELAPAIDPARYPLEILKTLYDNRPSPELKFIAFTADTRGFKLECEVASESGAGLCLDFLDRLQKDPGLSAFKIEAPAPKFVDKGTKYDVFGRL
jgi:hypothetical protein